MKKFVHILVLLTGLMVWDRENALAGNLRGKVIDGQGHCSQNTRVELCVWNATLSKWVPVAFAITGKDGFYYFTNIAKGQKVLLRIRGQYYPSAANPILVEDVRENSYQDIEPIVN